MRIRLKSASSLSSEPELMMDINTTPLIDVILVLLVMLIITIPIQLHAVNLELPVSTPPTNQIKPEIVQVDIDENNIVHWQGLPITSIELEEKMRLISNQRVQAEVHIRPNKKSLYATFAHVLSSSKRQNLKKIAVIGAEQFVE